MKKLLRVAALLLSVFLIFTNALAGSPVSSIIIMPWEISQNQRLPSQLKSSGFSHATFYLNWSDIEGRQGVYDFESYHGDIDKIVESGLSLIFVLDMGGRPYKNRNGQLVPNVSTVPQWIAAERPDMAMRNFSGDLSWQPDFTDEEFREYAKKFISKSIQHFSGRYPGKILGYAIGLQEEHEIKYGQMGYQWRDYKESTESAFYKKYNNRQPIISYNNDIAAGAPKSEPLLHAQKEFREDRLVEATCAYAKVIQNNGAEAIGYFAETFTSHDAIYGAGVVEKLQKCIDIAVIDFNFYDGYRLISDADILPVLANYMGSLGYKKIMVGAYGERWEAEKKTPKLVPLIQRSIEQSLLQSQVIGYEIGGFEHQTDGKVLASLELNKINQIAASVKTKSQKRLRIGILGSTSNFHVWHGERSAGRNIHHDTLFAAYKILSNQPDMEVHLIGEKNLLNDESLIQSLDAILIPHQVALAHNIKFKLTSFWKNGGALIQDMRLGEFDENGKPTFDWMHEVFGIGSIKWKTRGGLFLIDGTVYRLKPSKQLYASHASLTPRPGYQLRATEILQPGQGLVLRGERTLAFGFLPQLAEGEAGEVWRNLFVREISNLIRSQSSPDRSNG